MEQRYIAGDWVKNRGKLARIEETYRTNYFVKDYHDDYNPDIEYDDAYFFREVRPQDLVPIPLTYEMLEKNGWEKDDRGYYKSCIFLNKDGFGGWAVGFGEEYIRTIIFVHQLQHLLFGLGIDFDFNLEDNYENNQV